MAGLTHDCAGVFNSICRHPFNMDIPDSRLSDLDFIAGNEGTVRLFKVWGDLFLFEYPDKEKEYAQVETSDTYIVAWPQRGEPLYVFEDGEIRTKLDLKVWNALPLNRGYVVFEHGISENLILSVYSLPNDKMVLQRRIGSARGLEATPNERYVATWRITDATVYVYDVEDASESGRFCTRNTDALNVNLYGKIRNGKQVFEIEDNTSNTVVGCVTVDGTLSV